MKVGPAFFESITGEKKRSFGKSSRFSAFDLAYLYPVFFLLLFLAIIIIRLFYIQVLRGPYYKNLSDENRTRTEVIAAPRGIIFDRLNRPLVANSPSFKIVEGNPPKGEAGKIKLLQRDEALRLISEGKKVESGAVREYKYKAAFAHVLGYVGQISENEIILPEFNDYSPNDFVGKSGLEKEYEKILHGTNGKRLFEVDAKGAKIRELGSQVPVAGLNITTTLDLDMELSVYEAMKGVDRGAVIVSDPKTGGILAIYSSPTFDPNVFTHASPPAGGSSGQAHQSVYNTGGGYPDAESILLDTDKQPMLDRAIGGAYPPGSTFKLISAIAALEKGGIKPDTKIEDTGILKIGNFSFGNWYFLQYGRKEGPLDVVGAIKRSNDIFFYKAAEQTGVDYISSWANKFGHGSKLGIDLPDEASGTVPTVEWKEKEIGEQWYLGDTYNYGIGQGYLLATPLQVNMMTAVIANGGTLYRPHLLQDKKIEIKKQGFIRKENVELVRKGMLESCDTGGVAWPLFQFKVKNPKLKVDDSDFLKDASAGAQMVRIKLACKTGTAEIGGKETKPHSWITVFAPYHKPEIVVTVLVENGGEGSSIAGPIAKKILTDYFEGK